MALVMVALDGSVFAEQALPYARGLLRSGDELLLVRVVEPVPVSRSSHLVDLASRVLFREAEEYLDRLAGLLRERGTLVRTRLAGGRPRDELAREAEKSGAAWLVLSSHGSGGLRGLALGSVAEGVVRRSPCPVLVVRCQDPGGLDLSEPWRVPPPRVRKLLVPLDASAQAETALAFARKLEPSELVLVAATDGLVPEKGSNVPRLQAYLQSRAEEQSRAGEQSRAEEARRSPATPVECLVLDTFADEAIVQAVDRYRPDAVVMTTHGRRGLHRWLLGSTAERVLRRVDCPVVLLAPPAQAVGQETADREVARQS